MKYGVNSDLGYWFRRHRFAPLIRSTVCINLTRSAEGVTHLTFPPIPASSFQLPSRRVVRLFSIPLSILAILNLRPSPFFFFNIVQTLSFFQWREREREKEVSLYSSLFLSRAYIFYRKRRVFDFFQYFGNWADESTVALLPFWLVVRTITLPSGPPTRVATSTSLPRLLLPLYAPAPRSWITVIRGFLYIMRAYASVRTPLRLSRFLLLVALSRFAATTYTCTHTYRQGDLPAKGVEKG